MKRLLWVNHRDPRHPEAGGAERRMIEICSRLVRRGWDVTLVAERPPGSRGEEVIDGVRVVRVGGRVGVHLYSLLTAAVSGGHYDVVVDDIAHAVPWFSRLVTRTPVVAQVHHVHSLVLPYELGGFWSKALSLAERSAAHVYSHFITVSWSTKKVMVEEWGVEESRVAVIPNGVDSSRYTPTWSEAERPTILWLGRVKRYKRVHHVVAAYRLVRRRVSDAVLVVAGAGDWLPQVRRLARRLGVDDGVVFTGRVDEEEKIRLLRSSWVIVSTSIAEGWGLTVTEAAACGTPAVAYDVPGLRDSVVDGVTGILVRDGDIAALANAVVRLLVDDEERWRMARNARRYAEALDWGRVTDWFSRVLSLVAGEGR